MYIFHLIGIKRSVKYIYIYIRVYIPHLRNFAALTSCFFFFFFCCVGRSTHHVKTKTFSLIFHQPLFRLSPSKGCIFPGVGS